LKQTLLSLFETIGIFIVPFTLFSVLFLPFFQDRQGLEEITASITEDEIDALGDSSENWVIDGDTVYVDDSLVYASATPHTMNGGREDIVFEFESKTFSGDVDFAWGFNQNMMRPTDIWLWQNYSHPFYTQGEEEKYGCRVLNDVIDYTNLGIENYDIYDVNLGNQNNIYLFNVSYNYIASNGSYDTGIFAFSTYEIDGDDYTLCGNYNRKITVWDNQSYFDWNKWDVDYNHKSWNYEGMTDWYVTPNMNIQSGVRYKCKIRLQQTHFDLNDYSGKYWFAFKPSID